MSGPFHKVRQLKVTRDGEPVELTLFESANGFFAVETDRLDELDFVYDPYVGDELSLDPADHLSADLT